MNEQVIVHINAPKKFDLATDKEELFGKALVQMLGLKLRDGRVNTTFGSKTPLGLARTILHLADEADFYDVETLKRKLHHGE